MSLVGLAATVGTTDFAARFGKSNGLVVGQND